MGNYTTETGMAQRLVAGVTDTIVMSGPDGDGWADQTIYEHLEITNHSTTSTLVYTIEGLGGGLRTVGPKSTSGYDIPSNAGATITVTVAAGPGETPGYGVCATDEGQQNTPAFQWIQSPTPVVGQKQSQTIPDDTYTPLLWPKRHSGDQFITDRGLDAVATTITAASNGDILPQGTINVEDTTGFAVPAALPAPNAATPPEYAMIRDVSANTYQIVSYTGLTATSLTGCSLGSITLATGDEVRPAAFSVFGFPTSHGDGYLATMDVCGQWEGNATGRRDVRYNAKFALGTFWIDFIVYQGVSVFPNDTQPTNFTLHGQPGVPSGDFIHHLIEVRQTSGGDLELPTEGNYATICMQTFTAGRNLS